MKLRHYLSVMLSSLWFGTVAGLLAEPCTSSSLGAHPLTLAPCGYPIAVRVPAT